MSDSDYPHWKEALFGNGHAANAYCAVKYGFWHAAHLLLALVLLLVFVAVKAGKGIKRGIKRILPEKAPSGPSVNTPNLGVREALTSDTAKKISRVITAGIVALALILFVGSFIALLVMKTMATLAAVGAITLAVITLFGLLYVWEELGVKEWVFSGLGRGGEQVVKGAESAAKAAGKAKNKSKETPVVRRLLGYCPVSMDIDPKWFDKFEERLFDESL